MLLVSGSELDGLVKKGQKLEEIRDFLEEVKASY